MKKQFTQAKIKADSIDEKNYTIDFIATIEVKDRHGDIVDVDTMNFKDYDNNPVVLPQHNHWEASIGKTLEHWTETIDGKKAKIMRVKFAVEEYEVAKTYFALYVGGFMNAVSLGFIPERGEEIDGVFTLFGAKILELSCVTIPANQLALAKSKGLEIDNVVGIQKELLVKEARDLMVEAKNILNMTNVKTNVNKDHKEDCECATCKPKVNANLDPEKVETPEPVEPTSEQKKAESRSRAYKNIAKALRQI